ncbi:carboxymuconolactone decarboxylase family protein [[Actinomadura] parvosata]|uniref:carboxymuconolactone decarboxylase family protein n=1 Tax=[Actinomadura] parvosata TaxID=1955412 RepID=UPI00406C2859
MQARLQSRPNPDVTTAIQHLYKAIHSAGTDPLLLDLVHLRVSQVNSCSPCVYAAVASAKRRGESDERLHSVAAWRETPFFTDAERAALALAEAATRIQDGAPGVTDEIWETAAAHFPEDRLSSILTEVALTNFFNRINRAIGEQAGKTW